MSCMVFMDKSFFNRRKNLLYKKRLGVATVADLLELERTTVEIQEYVYTMKQKKISR